MFLIFIMVLFPTGDIAQKSELPLIGQSSPRSIVAPISFDVLKSPQELEEEKEKAREKIYPVFVYDEDTTKILSSNFEQLMSQIEEFSNLQREIDGANTANQEKITAAGNLRQSLIRKISTPALNHLIQNETSRDTLKVIFHSMLAKGVSNTLVAETNRDFTKLEEDNVNRILYSRGGVSLIKNGKETFVESDSIYSKGHLIRIAFDKYRDIFSSDYSKSAFYDVLYKFVYPNISYWAEETEKRREKAASEVNPSKAMIPRGMEIISQGSIVTKETLEILEAMQSARLRDAAKFSYTAPYGQRILLLLIVSMLCLNLWNFRSKKNVALLKIWAVAIIAITQIILFRLVHDFFLTLIQNEYLNPVWFYPFAFAPVLTSVLFPLRIANALAIWSSVLFGIFAGYDLSMCIISYLISLTMSLIVNRIRYRVRFMQALCAGLAILALSLTGILLLRNSMSWGAYWQNFLLGASNLLLCVTFISVFCNIFERIFQITTNLKLAELSDFNHPLLRFLSEYAPGSFHHSIQVGNLGEIAGERIGANTLLIRVMALYHDIGKTMRPEYFTENQRFDYNPHDNISPYDSIKILRAHIERGIEFAEEYNLPDPVAAGIREHHGTSVAYYFYSKAKEMYPDREVKFSDFCYKGTIPQNKETAVLMLADSIEAISRSIQNANPDQLSKMIQKNIEDKMFDNQLNDSGLTIQDLKELGEGFLQGLEGSIHSRVQYPTNVFSRKTRGMEK